MMELDLVAGRNFSGDLRRHWNEEEEMDFLLTASAARAFGWSEEEAVGKRFEYPNTNAGDR